MIDGLLGEKLGMTQLFADNGDSVPVTVISVGPCTVIQKKNSATDGYDAIQIGYQEKQEGKSTKPIDGHYKKNGLVPCSYLKELRGEYPDVSVGDKFGADLFENIGQVTVTANSKGKGFAGVMKRHNFAGGPAGHGSGFHRRAGSIGASAYPSRVIKGTKMAGRMGNARVTIKGLDVVRVDAEKGLVFLKGGVPGPDGTVLLIRKQA